MKTQVKSLAEFPACDKHIGNVLKGARPRGICVPGDQGRENVSKIWDLLYGRRKRSLTGFGNEESLLPWEDAGLKLWWGWDLAAGRLYTLKKGEAKGDSMTFKY